MKNQITWQDHIRRVYEKTYRGILSDRVIKGSAEWLISFIESYKKQWDAEARLDERQYIRGQKAEEFTKNLSLLRQWLNERPKDAPLLTTEDLLIWFRK